MYVDPLAFNLMMTTGAVISLVQVVVVLYLVFLTRRYWNLKRHLESVKENYFKKGEEIIEEASRKGLEIEEHARESREQISKILEENVLKAVSKDLEKEIKGQTERFREAAEKKLIELESVMEAEVAQERQVRLKRLDEEIFGIIAKVSEEVLGRAISTKEEEVLVIEALESAKKNF